MTRRYYAVRAGRVPGIYETWGDCEDQITGFAGARFKGFATRDAAEVFMRGGNDRPRHELGHERKRSRPKATARPPEPVRQPRSRRSVYSGTRPPWEFPTFIECLDGENNLKKTSKNA